MGDFWEVLKNGLPEFVDGFQVTVQLVAISFFIAIIVGTVVASFRIAPLKPLNFIGTIYVEAFRNIPLLVLLFITFAGFARGGFPVAPLTSATASLGLYTAAYVAEAIRSGVFAIGKGQLEAAQSLGFTFGKSLRKIILPQAFRTVIPPLGNLMIAMIKNSAIIGASLVTIRPDLLKTARIIQNNTFKTTETFFWAGVGYLILTLTATLAVRYLEKRLAIRR
ncbi:MAG: amino acid ABC transporter permease [Actinomycetota bacterium]|nr:amino acid ABC transporter permease [Actinomycetota bacterium]